MRILILSDGFSAPAYKPRLRALCDYLHAQGHSMDVFCEQADSLDFAHAYPIHEIRLYSGHRADWALKNGATMLFNWKERAFERQVERQIRGKAYDLVFCTTFYTFPMRTANRIAARRGIPSVVDLRDMVEQAPANQMLYLGHHNTWLRPFGRLYQRQNIRRRNRELCRASAITTISPWHVALVRSISDRPCHLIYNGYDSSLFRPKDVPSEQFRLIYTGKVFPRPQQDPALLFEGIKRSGLSPKALAVDWYSDEASTERIRSMAAEAGVEAWMQYHGMVPQAQIAELLHEASVCLVLTSRASDTTGHGMMTTKFFEALGVEKPVLCVESDEECLAQVVRETKAGLSATDAEQVKAFLLDTYAEWQANGFTRRQVDKEQKRLFSRQEQARQWEQLFCFFGRQLPDFSLQS